MPRITYSCVLMKHIHSNLLFYIFIGIGLLAFFAFSMIGGYVEEDTGILREPFFLIPMGSLFIFMGTLGILSKVAYIYIKKQR